ncbi:MAG: undecaprenyl-diphosphate phosphatase [Halieaceae bacterium]|nr:undecaprenyl-diphosphate phosphatase [Halieaceae bacterium]
MFSATLAGRNCRSRAAVADWVQVVLLALIQGVTEFLPVSSSAHLILPAQIWGWVDQGLLFDVAVHAGTLCAVLWYFRDTIINLARSILPGGPTDQSELWALVVATVPVVLAGLLLKDVIATDARAVNVIIVTTLLFGVLLGVADRLSRRGAKHTGAVSLRDALLIGLVQVFALIPGASRSGVTITAALFLGYHPAAATRFSFLLSVPVIGAAVMLMLFTMGSGQSSLSGGVALTAFGISAIFAYATIKAFMYWVERIGLMPFVLYRLALGLVLWVWIIQG